MSDQDERVALVARMREIATDPGEFYSSEITQVLHAAAEVVAQSRQVVETAVDASNLTLGTVLRDAQDDIWERYREPGGKCAWRSTGDGEPRSSNWIVYPATVLYRPVGDETGEQADG